MGLFHPSQLVSLLDLLRDYAARYIHLGRRIEYAMTVFYMASNTTVKMDESAGIQAGLGPAPVGLGALAQAARSKVITEYEELSAS